MAKVEPGVAAKAVADQNVALEVRNLCVRFRQRNRRDVVTVVDDVCLRLERGRSLALVGESGSGKSVAMRAVLGLLPPTATVSGQAWLTVGGERQDLIGLNERRIVDIRGRHVGMVFQNAMDAMNPTVPLLRQLTEPLLWHGICSAREAKRRAVAALADVGISEPARTARMYPFQLSGGMRQRAMIAMATIAEPAVLIADEPTTALDVTVQRKVLDLLSGFKKRGTSIILITHDLGVARYLCDDIAVMYAGQLMERADMASFIRRPEHPYSIGLLASALEVNQVAALSAIPGQPPDMADRPTGCAFHPRCAQVELPACRQPQVLTRRNGRDLRCWKVTEDG